MKKYNTIIIDEDKNSRKTLVSFAETYFPELLIRGSAATTAEGIKLLENNNIDIIFLDISIPEETINSFTASLPDDKYAIIYVSSLQQDSVKALKANVVEFLLKPIHPIELEMAINKAIRYLLNKNDSIQTQVMEGHSLSSYKLFKNLHDRQISRITVAEQFGFKMVNVDDLMYLKSNSNYTVLHLSGGSTIVATRNLGEFERILTNQLFFRIHKSTLVNVNHLTGFSSFEGNYAELKDGTRLAVSRRKLMEFRIWVKQFSVPMD